MVGDLVTRGKNQTFHTHHVARFKSVLLHSTAWGPPTFHQVGSTNFLSHLDNFSIFCFSPFQFPTPLSCNIYYMHELL